MLTAMELCRTLAAAAAGEWKSWFFKDSGL
jgi:hypothetical protein